jgi:hypothetical protein
VLDYLLLEITTPLIVNIYKPPVYPIRLFCTILGKLLAEINVKMPQIPCVILGDFNDNILDKIKI